MGQRLIDEVVGNPCATRSMLHWDGQIRDPFKIHVMDRGCYKQCGTRQLICAYSRTIDIAPFAVKYSDIEGSSITTRNDIHLNQRGGTARHEDLRL
jgi:hypothetical protein